MEGVWTSSKLTPPGTLCLHSGLLPQCRSAKTPPVGALVTCCPGLLWLRVIRSFSDYRHTGHLPVSVCGAAVSPSGNEQN